MPRNFFHTFTVTSAAIPGALSATLSGAGGGVTQSLTAANNARALLSARSNQGNSLFEALQVLFADPAELDHSVLETYMNEIKDGLIATNDAMALIVRNVLLGTVSAVSHVSQVPSDLVTVGSKTGEGLSKLKIPSKDVEAASKKASLLDVNVDGFSASVRSITAAMEKQGGPVLDEVYKAINVDNNSHAATHARAAAVTSAGGSVLTTAALPAATALLTDTVGHVLKEASALKYVFSGESASEGEHNIYQASTGVAKATKASDCQASKLQSEALKGALSNLEPLAKLMSGRGISTPLSTALLRLVVLSLFVEASRGVNKTALAVSEGRLQKALADATAQGPSGGVDRIDSLHSNLSSLSNIMRLCAENLKEDNPDCAQAIKGTAQSSEVLSSRALSVLLSHVSPLAEALNQLTEPQPADAAASSSGKTTNSPVDLANPGVLGKSEATIRAVLDRVEKENGLHVIPGLNPDMAAQLSASARTGVASMLATHSLFSNPVTLATKASKEAAKTDEAHKNEALIASLPGLTQVLNTIQAFTRNLMTEMEKAMEKGVSAHDGSLLSGHKSSASSTATTFWAVSAVFLLCDEMLSVCRSLTLIDQNRLQAASQKASAVPSKAESAQSAEQISWDSHSQQEYSATHAATALRLTLSHTGIALMRIVIALHQALDGHMDTVQQGLAMHTLQRSLLASTAYASQYLAEGLMLSTGVASAFPLAAKGSVNWSHKKVHTTDAHLHPAQTHHSEECSDSSESSQATGFSTDMVAGTITNVLKVLAQGSLIGLDTVLRLIKILEIVSLHRDSHIALRLESQDASNPNGISQNSIKAPSAGSLAGTSAILFNLLAAFQSVDKCSGSQSTLNAQNRLKEVIDQQIEELAVLKDEEEERQNKQGLKAFYRIIINLLAPALQADCDHLVQRLHFGGIALSDYHSRFGAYSERAVGHARLVSTFANEDDAQGVLRKFIDEAKENYPLLKALHEALPEEQRSQKAQVLYRNVFEEVFQHYKQAKMSDLAQHGASRRKIPNRDTFQIDIGLRQEVAEVVVPGPQI